MKINQLFLAIGLASLPLLSGCLTEKEKQDLKDRILLTEEERKAKKLEQQRLERELAKKALDNRRKESIKSSPPYSAIRTEIAKLCSKQNINCLEIKVTSTNYAGKNSKGNYIVDYDATILHSDDGWTRRLVKYQGNYKYDFIGDSDEYYSSLTIQPVAHDTEAGTGAKIAGGIALGLLGKAMEN